MKPKQIKIEDKKIFVSFKLNLKSPTQDPRSVKIIKYKCVGCTIQLYNFIFNDWPELTMRAEPLKKLYKYLLWTFNLRDFSNLYT